MQIDMGKVFCFYHRRGFMSSASFSTPPIMHQSWTWHRNTRSFERTYLYEDHLRRDSWSLKGYKSEIIQVEDISNVDIVPCEIRGRSWLGLHLRQSGPVVLAIYPAFLWKERIKKLMRIPKWRSKSDYMPPSVPVDYGMMHSE